MHELILRFPNKRTYDGTLRATHAANARELPTEFSEWFGQYFKKDDRGDKDKCPLTKLFVDGECSTVASKTIFVCLCRSTLMHGQKLGPRQQSATPESPIWEPKSPMYNIENAATIVHMVNCEYCDSHHV